MLALVGVAILGAIDGLRERAHRGSGTRRFKLVWQTAVAVLAAWYIQRHFEFTAVNLPFAGDRGRGAVIFVLFVAFVHRRTEHP